MTPPPTLQIDCRKHQHQTQKLIEIEPTVKLLHLMYANLSGYSLIYTSAHLVCENLDDPFGWWLIFYGVKMTARGLKAKQCASNDAATYVE